MPPRKSIAVGGVASIALALTAAAVPAQAAPLGEWDFSETRATGHYERTAEGLHIWTEGAASTDKVAGYLDVDLALADTLSGGLDYAATSGGIPGAQFVVDIDGNGTPDGILVGEPVYGDNWWLTNGSSAAFKAADPSGAENGGNGSEWFGTLAQWSAAAPGARIVKVGFSLGSGVQGDGVVRAVVAGDQRYTFTSAPVITNVIADGTVVGGNASFVVELADDNISYTYIELNRGGTWLTDNTKSPGSHNSGLQPKLAVDLGAYPDGDYALKIVAVDADGLSVSRNVPIVIDNTKPAVTIDAPASGAVVAGTVPVKVTLDDAHLKSYNLRVDSAGLSYAYQAANGAQPEFSWDTTTLADGEHTLLATATDAAGNKTVTTTKVIVDNTGPVVSIDAPAAGANLRGTVGVKVTLDDAHLKSYNLRVDSAGLSYAYQAANGAQPEFSWDTKTVADGPHTLLATATDEAGNKTVTTLKVNIDNTRPTLEVVSPAEGEAFAASEGVAIEVQAADPGKLGDIVVNLYRDGTLLKSLGKQSPAAAAGWTGSWTLPAGLADGTYTLKAGVNDLAGNNRTVTRTFAIDSSLAEQGGETSPGDGEETPGDGEEIADGGPEQSLAISVTEVHPGDSVKITGANFGAGASVELELHSVPVKLGSAIAGEQGAFDFDAIIPASTPAGEHEVVAIFGDGSELRVPITVTEASAAASVTAPAATTAGNGLADTGIDGFGIAGLAALLLGAGAVLVAVMRRRAARGGDAA